MLTSLDGGQSGQVVTLTPQLHRAVEKVLTTTPGVCWIFEYGRVVRKLLEVWAVGSRSLNMIHTHATASIVFTSNGQQNTLLRSRAHMAATNRS